MTTKVIEPTVSLITDDVPGFRPQATVALAEVELPPDVHPLYRVLGIGVHTDPAIAMRIATAEIAERYAVVAVPWNRFTFGPIASRPHRIDPRMFHERSRERAEAFGLSLFHSDQSYYWTRAREIRSGRRVEILADFCYAYERKGYPQKIAVTTSSGVAAHTIASNAQRAALLELYERDALMLIWMNRAQPPRISAERLPEAARSSLENVRRLGYTCVSLDGTCRSVPVAFAVAYRSTTPALVFCAGAECSLGEAAVHAWREAEMELFWRLREAQHGVSNDPLAPEHVTTSAHHARLYNDPAHTSLAAFLWANEQETSRDPSAAIDMSHRENGGFDLKTFARAHNLDAVYEVRYGSFLGFHVVRLLVPSLVPIAFGWNQFPVDHPARYVRCSVPTGSPWPGSCIPPHPLS